MVALVFSNVGGYPFVLYDDPLYIHGNPYASKGLTLSGIRWALTAFMGANWHPLTWISHMIDISLFGMDAGKHHLVNVLIHLVDTVLLFHVLRRMTGRIWECAMVAALFAVHPLHVESVAWVAERKDVLSALFFLLTLWAYARYCEKPGWRRYLAVFFTFAIGLTVKPMLVTLPFVLILLDFWPLARPFVLPEKVPLLALSALSSCITYMAQAKGGALAPIADLPAWARLLNALGAYGGYLWKTVWPARLAAFYPHPMEAIPVGTTSAAVLALIVGTAFAMRQRRVRPYIAVGWLWYVGTLVPVAGFVQVGLQSMADRYTYIPLIGIFIAVAWGAGELAGRSGFRIPVAVAAVGWLAILAVVARNQAGYWRDTETLFTHSIETAGDSGFARNMLGASLAGDGKVREAERQYLKAILLRPEYADAYNNLGLLLYRDGRTKEAILDFREAIRSRPGFSEAYFNLGKALARDGADEEAAARFREAIRLKPDYPEAHNNLGVLLARRGDYPGAIDHFRRALRIDPDSVSAGANLRRALAQQASGE
jgi:tetratricopeptide (TPR) repeat protein